MSIEMEIKYIDGNVPEPYRYAQALLDRFVAVCYDATYHALHFHSYLNNTDFLCGEIIPILRDNPPFTTLPKYLRDGRPNYLWYSDFYDYAGKDVFRRYREFHYELKNITPANYTEELRKIDLPYFTELVKLISLEKLYLEVVQRIPATKEKTSDESANVSVANTDVPVDTAVKKQINKRSYEPKLDKEQYTILVELIENIKLFRSPVTEAKLTRLFKGKSEEPLQVANQNSLTYLFDQLARLKLIREKWMTVAANNNDFISFRRGKNKERYGDKPHYITLQQFTNCRYNNEKIGSKDLITIDAAIERLEDWLV